MSSPNPNEDYTDLLDRELVSNCCEAPVYEGTDFCSDCKEHCDPIPIEESEMTLGAMDRF